MPRLYFSCPETIAEHPKTENGHFCTACSKNVVDFRNFSAAEMRNYFKNNPGKSCGIFHTKQIIEPLQTSLSSIFRFAFGLVFFFGICAADLRAQTLPDSTKTNVQNTQGTLVTGTVTSENETVPFVRIAVYSNSGLVVHTNADIDGNYRLVIPAEHASKALEIAFFSIGLEELRVQINPQNQSFISLDAALLPGPPIMLGVVIETENDIIMPHDPYDFGKTRITGEDLKRRQR